MTRMTGPDCAVMCNLINTQTHTHPMRDYHWGTRLNAMLWGFCCLTADVFPIKCFDINYNVLLIVQNKSSGCSEGRATSITRTLEQSIASA